MWATDCLRKWHKLHWNCDLLTNTTVHFKWPDIILVVTTNKEAAFNGIAILLTHSLRATITLKQHKYQEIVFDNRQQWQLNKNCYSICLACYTGHHNTLNQSLTTINSPPCLLSQVQKVFILSTCCIKRKFLSDEVHYTAKRWLTTHSHEILLRSWLYTLTSTNPDTTACTPCTHQHHTQPQISHFVGLATDYSLYSKFRQQEVIHNWAHCKIITQMGLTVKSWIKIVNIHFLGGGGAEERY